MKVVYTANFAKNLAAIKNVNVRHKLDNIITEIKTADRLSEIQNVKSIEGYKGYYRIKIGIYRLGFEFKNQEIIFKRFLPRKDIYKGLKSW